MKDTLTYRCSGDSGFNAAINGCKEWIDKNCNGPLTLTYSITLKLTPPEGETLREISKTQPLFPNGTDAEPGIPRQKRHRRTKAEMQAMPASE